MSPIASRSVILTTPTPVTWEPRALVKTRLAGLAQFTGANAGVIAGRESRQATKPGALRWRLRVLADECLVAV